MQSWPRSVVVAQISLWLTTSSVHSQTGNAKSLEAGNKWLYFFETESGQAEQYYEIVAKDTLIGDIAYAIIEHHGRMHENGRLERADSSRIYQFSFADSSERLICDFNAAFGDSAGEFVVLETSSREFWGKTRRFVRYYYHLAWLIDQLVEYAEGIGATAIGYDAHGVPPSSATLVGAILDGVVYGDTTLTRVEELIPSAPPAAFHLHQNYPNPFPSGTTIRYEILRQPAQPVKLSIHNMTGREVINLVNQRQSVGEYRVKWHGLDQQGLEMPSGVYYYRLSIGRVQQVKKLVLIR